MNEKCGIVIVNPGRMVSPANFRRWLQISMMDYESDPGRAETVAGILPITYKYAGAIGHNKLAKVIQKEVSKHAWLRSISISYVDELMDDKNAAIYVDAFLENLIHDSVEPGAEGQAIGGSAKTDEGGLFIDPNPSCFLGYANEDHEGVKPSAEPEFPVCTVVQTDEDNITEFTAHSKEYSVGDWAVIIYPAPMHGAFTLLPPVKKLEDAFNEAKANSGALRFVAMS